MAQVTYPYPDSEDPKSLLAWARSLVVVLKRTQTQDFPFTRNPTFALVQLPPADSRGAFGASVFVTDEAGGPTLAYSDGTHWRRVADRAIVS